MAVPDRRTITFTVLIVGGAALVLWLMMQNRAERGGAYAEGDTSTDEPRLTVGVLNRLVGEDRETANRWFGGKNVRVSGSVCLVTRTTDEAGAALLIVG